MLINEEGKLQDMKYNKVATDISRVFEYDMIVGDVVLCKINGEHLVGFDEMVAKDICDELKGGRNNGNGRASDCHGLQECRKQEQAGYDTLAIK